METQVLLETALRAASAPASPPAAVRPRNDTASPSLGRRVPRARPAPAAPYFPP